MPADPASSSLPDPRTVRAATVAGLLVAGVVFVVVLLWAKLSADRVRAGVETLLSELLAQPQHQLLHGRAGRGR